MVSTVLDRAELHMATGQDGGIWCYCFQICFQNTFNFGSLNCSKLQTLTYTQIKVLLKTNKYKSPSHNELTKASFIICLATTDGAIKPAEPEICFVSSGFVFSSLAKPGVSVSGGRAKVTEILYGLT